MTSIGRPTSIQGAAVPMRRRDLKSPNRRTRGPGDTLETKTWTWYRAVPAISNYVTVLSNAADLVSYYPGLLDPEASEPIKQDIGPVFEVWEGLGGEAAVSEWISSFVTHLSVPGQAWFVPLTRPNLLAQITGPLADDLDMEDIHWEVVSTADLKRLLDLPPEKGIPEDDNRIWRVYEPDPENSKDPTSAVRRVAAQANILTLIDRRVETDLYSRIYAGVWPLPSTLRDVKNQKGKYWDEVLEEGLLAAAEPGALEARVPLLAFVELQELQAMREPIKLFIDDGDRLAKLKAETLKDLAVGLDAPMELTTGMNTLNHWGAWLVREETYSQHLDPLIVRTLRSLNPWWHAQLEAAGISNFEDYVLWRNPATAINRPNSFQEAMNLHDRFVISDDSLRRSADKDDTDAPDDEEIERRIEIQRALNAPATASTADQTRNVPDTNPIQGATGGRPLPLARLARRLTSIDQTALAKLEAEAVRQLAPKRKALFAQIEEAAEKRGLQAAGEELPMQLGPQVVQELIPGNLAEPDDFEADPFEDILAEAQLAAAAAVSTVGAVRDEEADRNDRRAASGFLLEMMAGALIGSLFRRPDTSGESRPGSEWIPTGELRSAMDLAGGGVATHVADEAWEMIGNGRRTVEALTAVNVQTEGFQWAYGSALRKTFEPHLRLDGRTFTRWDSPILLQAEASWVSGDYFFPGDHRGCACSYFRTLVTPETFSDLDRTNQERLDQVDANPRPGIDDNPEIVASARDWYVHARSREESISRFLDPIANSSNGQFQHYGERVKFESSIREKIWREMQADPSLNVAQATRNVTDINRYTLTWDADNLYAGRHAQTVQGFNDAGWQTIADKNAWAPGDAYDGMNYKFMKGDDIVEVQFHTPQSAVIKDESHLLYSQARIMPPGPEKDRMLAQVLDLWNTDRSHIPPGMENVGTASWYDL